jgi:hypothetical protein
MSKNLRIVYLICTGLLLLQMTGSGVANLLRIDDAMRTISLLGYPPYFPIMLGVAKLLGAVVLVFVPNHTLKEWAYAGFCFDILAATISHLAVGNYSVELVAAIVGLVFLFGSYFLYRLHLRATINP